MPLFDGVEGKNVRRLSVEDTKVATSWGNTLEGKRVGPTVIGSHIGGGSTFIDATPEPLDYPRRVPVPNESQVRAKT